MSNQDSTDQSAQRRAKLAQLRAEGDPYPNDFKRDALAADLQRRFGDRDQAALEAAPTTVTIAGRMMTRRVMGKAAFVHLQDMSGRIQLYLRREELGEGCYEAFKDWDIGDVIGAAGSLFKTKTGELSVAVQSVRLLAKSLHPLPEKFHGLSDVETRYRQRYLDLIMNEASRRVFERRSAIIDFIRDYLKGRGYVEVETPMMQLLPGGAAARPFVTHHHALDMELYLRIAPELFLKRLVVGGLEKVFEINRNFRNEGLSTRHNPEFTMLEFYEAYADYGDLMDRTEDLIRKLALAVLGNTTLLYQDEEFDLSRRFTRMTLKEAIMHFNPGLAAETLERLDPLSAYAKQLGIAIEAGFGLGKIQLEIFEKTVEEKLRAPCFITAYPTEVSPLARRNAEDPSVTDRFEFFIAGQEIANGFSELNDPEDQAERFRRQAEEKEAGHEEAMHYDADYVLALEYGLPPTAGEGIGIDRLVMLLTDSRSIRDVLLFPHMRPRTAEGTTLSQINAEPG
ncbi:MAG: Lysine--tRNA ligase, heat inducible [Chromatiales bacterium USCg_Taylor]|nr:MAG: Lysine--tRNA ligase, heat inducible [Chromatiales bacterium USCg_Taylor]